MGNTNSIGEILGTRARVEKLDKSGISKDKSEIHVNANYVDIYYSTKHAMMIRNLHEYYRGMYDHYFTYKTKNNKTIYTKYLYNRIKIVLSKDDSLNIKKKFDSFITDLNDKFNIRLIFFDNECKIFIPLHLFDCIYELKFLEGDISMIYQPYGKRVDIHQSNGKIIANIECGYDHQGYNNLDVNFDGTESELRSILDKITYRILEASVPNLDM